MRGSVLVSFSFLVVSAACSRGEKPTPSAEGKPEQELPIKGALVAIAVGDIGVCGTTGDEATGRLADSLLRVDSAQGTQTIILTLGDNAYPSGDQGIRNYFNRCFGTSWGGAQFMNIIHPAPGNHDYDTGSGAPYFEFFGSRAGPGDRGYYSFDANGWHFMSLNSELYSEAGYAERAKAQEDWLRADLQQHRTTCAIAYFHRPRFSSGIHGMDERVKKLWEILYEGGVDLVLNGHDHDYERFLPQNESGVADSLRGMEQIVSGTGGAALRAFRHPLARNSAAQIEGRFGVLKLTLGDGEYRRAFITTDGTVWDVGGRRCR